MRFDAEMLDAVGVIVTAMATIFLVIATVLLAKATNRLNQISEDLKSTQHRAALTQALNVQNSVVLSSDENLMIADSLIAEPGMERSARAARERWICFVLLNVQALIFSTRNQDQSMQGTWEAVQRGVLDHLLENDSVMHLLRTRGYTLEFVKYCETRREKIRQRTGE
ncbi:MAG TPA: hypothetical protein VMF56_14325 [Acidobacteriaceae bacterium]|nr:hypothetical protein [Acidobacteriaceae bacterium]